MIWRLLAIRCSISQKMLQQPLLLLLSYATLGDSLIARRTIRLSPLSSRMGSALLDGAPAEMDEVRSNRSPRPHCALEPRLRVAGASRDVPLAIG